MKSIATPGLLRCVNFSREPNAPPSSMPPTFWPSPTNSPWTGDCFRAFRLWNPPVEKPAGTIICSDGIQVAHDSTAQVQLSAPLAPIWHCPLSTGKRAWTRSWPRITPIGVTRKRSNPSCDRSRPFSESPNGLFEVLYHHVQTAEKQNRNQYHHRPTNQPFAGFSRRSVILLDPVYEAIEHGTSYKAGIKVGPPEK